MRAASFLGLIAAIGQAGCAGRAPVETAKLTERIEELSQRESSLRKDIEEMQNRLFLLEDKVDTSRVAIERKKPPRLPVVRLRPQPSEAVGEGESELAARSGESDDSEEEHGEPAEAEQPPGGRSVVARRSVVYDGEASREGPRPVLRLHGSIESGGSSLSSSSPAVDLGGVNEKLPVVPVPSRASAAAAAASAARRMSRRQSDPEPRQEYQSALAKYRGGLYAEAAEAFRRFIQRYAQHAYADNALYWLAECSYDVKNYHLALKFFRQVVEQYPAGNKAPDALLKMAYCYVQMNDKRNARTVLGQVMESYPRTQVAKLASEAMAKL